MKPYYVSSDQGATLQAIHVVHRADCEHLPEPMRRIYVGHFGTGVGGLTAARTVYPNATACLHCCPECNLLPALPIST